MAILRSLYAVLPQAFPQAQEASSLGIIRYEETVCLENTGAGRFCGRLIQPCPLHSIDESTVNQDPIESRAKLLHLLMISLTTSTATNRVL
eukprot:scaffold6547_cov141-Skeletonema_dohrnii-CCMP3373.AAC.4